MMARRGVLGFLAAGTTAVLSGCGLFRKDKKYRFKMIVEVDTPQGVKRGSSVYEVEAFGIRDLVTRGSGSRAEVRGEAVAVDVAPGKTLFALLKTTNNMHPDLATMSMVALDPGFDYDRVKSTERIASGEGISSPAMVPADYYPMLVTFKDIGDPTSVERVEPTNLAGYFGEDVKLKSILLEVTDESVTTGIEERLNEFGMQEGQGLDRRLGVTANPTLAQQLGFKDFARR